MIPERVTGQIGQNPVILMPVVAVMGKDNFRIEFRTDLLKPVLDCWPFTRKVALAERSNLDLSSSYASQEFIRAPGGFIGTWPWSAENNPADFQVGILSSQLEQRTAGPDLDIIRVRTKTQDPAY